MRRRSRPRCRAGRRGTGAHLRRAPLRRRPRGPRARLGGARPRSRTGACTPASPRTASTWARTRAARVSAALCSRRSSPPPRRPASGRSRPAIFPENAASVRLHEAVGFRVVGRRERLGQARRRLARRAASSSAAAPSSISPPRSRRRPPSTAAAPASCWRLEPLAQHDRGQADGDGRIERRQHRDDADEPARRREREEHVGGRVADADGDDCGHESPCRYDRDAEREHRRRARASSTSGARRARSRGRCRARRGRGSTK